MRPRGDKDETVNLLLLLLQVWVFLILGGFLAHNFYRAW